MLECNHVHCDRPIRCECRSDLCGQMSAVFYWEACSRWLDIPRTGCKQNWISNRNIGVLSFYVFESHIWVVRCLSRIEKLLRLWRSLLRARKMSLLDLRTKKIKRSQHLTYGALGFVLLSAARCMGGTERFTLALVLLAWCRCWSVWCILSWCAV